MFVRAKKVGLRRYAYLVEGAREGRRVIQRTLCYLGPVSKLVSGVPDDTRRKVGERFQVDWNKINREIGRIPLTFEELSEARRAQYAVSIRTRQAGFRSQGDLPRAEGELSALSRLAATKFREMFEAVGDREYRMR
ncbi:MAG TPA: hypothetical protein VIH34_05010 [Candidatus Bathyarchaeia archaeon]